MSPKDMFVTTKQQFFVLLCKQLANMFRKAERVETMQAMYSHEDI